MVCGFENHQCPPLSEQTSEDRLGFAKTGAGGEKEGFKELGKKLDTQNMRLRRGDEDVDFLGLGLNPINFE